MATLTLTVKTTAGAVDSLAQQISENDGAPGGVFGIADTHGATTSFLSSIDCLEAKMDVRFERNSKYPDDDPNGNLVPFD